MQASFEGKYNCPASQVALIVKNPPAKAGDARDMPSFPGCEDLLEEGLAAHQYSCL